MKKSKHIALLHGKEEGYWWNISCRISDTGKVKESGIIRYRNEKNDESLMKYRQENKDLTRKYNIEYRKNHPQNWKNWKSFRNRKNKEIVLGLYYEDGNSFILRQMISKDGNVYGIGYFTLLRSSADSARYHRNHNAKNLILLNDYFPTSELHHLNDKYGVYIPKDLHHSVFHNLKKNINMDRINALALKYLDSHNNKNKKANYFK